MQTKWIKKLSDQEKIYDGTQLRSLFAYLRFQVLGDSCISWRGPCDVSFEHMVDGEDLLQQAQICGSDMVHFIFEIFDQSLMTGVLLQRLFASTVADVIHDLSGVKNLKLERQGDDLYWKGKKLSISIATRSPTSVLVHFAVNVSTEGTPVPTVGLKDLRVDPDKFALRCLKEIAAEYLSCQQATKKVRAVK
ncbi:MAG: DUF366 domain-containing protein [Bdellovibrio sp. CG10_big_fil_rev_8_21_14_0_10_47_8]|nr:MAG: DUF366 domain-containing protein [Bdellovibrio sp. CG10_big_fil_rev_8_21_14_0_10_47_8]